ncbi:glycosyltransferase [Kiloniella majae]|uniref:glycosyltransferase n=1 Tax=Kiloniella majae TaxID=1938558 RepID=UPI0015C4F453|nr:glycosyltransferase [Kiloniella majae]
MGKKSEKVICFVIGALERGGAETHLCRILPLLNQSPYRVMVFCFERKGSLAPELEQQGVEVHETTFFQGSIRHSLFFRPILLLASFISFFCLIFTKKPDAVHFFLPRSYLLFGPLSLISRKCKKLMSRRSLNRYQERYPPFVRNFELWLHTKMDFVVGNSLSVVDELRGEGVPEEKLKLIYNGISQVSVDPVARDLIRSDLGVPSDSVMMTIVANLIPYKGHMDLLEACAKLSCRKWNLVIVGEDFSRIKKTLEDFTMENNLRQNVYFAGVRTDVSEIWAASDVGLLVSHEEGFSNALLEGMSAELPMVVTSVGGNSEAVINGVTGFVVPPKNPETLRRALLRLINDVELREEMGRKSRERVEKEFSVNKCLSQYRSLYNQTFS